MEKKNYINYYTLYIYIYFFQRFKIFLLVSSSICGAGRMATIKIIFIFRILYIFHLFFFFFTFVFVFRSSPSLFSLRFYPAFFSTYLFLYVCSSLRSRFANRLKIIMWFRWIWMYHIIYIGMEEESIIKYNIIKAKGLNEYCNLACCNKQFNNSSVIHGNIVRILQSPFVFSSI